ncbi:xylulokinase [Oscillospiraceae bacterium HV4-5-C5C]|nr:xylulokinase [Oscillospiraceae bacterium HV4-5-C5C]
MRYVLGIDIGTSATKTGLYREDGTEVAQASAAYPLYQPQNGWAEQDPEDWWEAVAKTIREVLKQSGVPAAAVAGVGMSGQMHGLVMLDEHNQVIRPSIIWCDQRTGEEVTWLNEHVGRDRLIELTANPPVTGFTLAKLLWVRRNEPDHYARCRKILLPKDYIRFRLTGQFATEVSDASGMQLLDVSRRDWSLPLLKQLDIDPAWLAPVYESPVVSARVDQAGAQACGLLVGTPVVGGAGDNAAAAVGTGVVTEGRAFTTIGTSGVVFAHTNQMKVDPRGRVHTFCCAVPGAWHIMSVTQGAGLSLSWFRDQFCQNLSAEAAQKGESVYRLMDDLAARIPAGSDRLIYLPYLMGERTPWLDPDCRGVFFGLSAMHTQAHLIRAVMEGVTFSQLDGLNIMRGLDLNVEDMRATGGGASPFWRQMLADIYDCPVSRLEPNGGPALGAAILAAVGAGIYPDVPTACAKTVQLGESSQPDPALTQAYQKTYRLYDQLYPLLQPAFAQLKQL